MKGATMTTINIRKIGRRVHVDVVVDLDEQQPIDTVGEAIDDDEISSVRPGLASCRPADVIPMRRRTA
jgi:hypothetical protein